MNYSIRNQEVTHASNNSRLNLSYQEQNCDTVLKLIEPIIKVFPIEFFSQMRVYKYHAISSLMSDTALSLHYLEKRYPICICAEEGIKLDTGFYVMEHAKEMHHCQRKDEIRELFNLDYLVCIIDKSEHYDDAYFFATSPDNPQFINQLINHLDVIKHFILYFKEKSSALMDKAPKLLYPKDTFQTDVTNDLTLSKNSFQDECSNNMPIKKIQLNVRNQSIKVTMREYQSLNYLAKGLSMKEVGKVLGLSPRTVETYINNLKDKLAVDTKRQLLQVFEDIYLLN